MYLAVLLQPFGLETECKPFADTEHMAWQMQRLKHASAVMWCVTEEVHRRACMEATCCLPPHANFLLHKSHQGL